jgi:diadenosine tetraphosphatase ApaH/serine/threonine PP2A family protein phosphatase
MSKIKVLISDIHGNLIALKAVLADVESKYPGADIYCLGDVVGYGPWPIECLDLVLKKCRKAILGNHDLAVILEPDGFNGLALEAILWTREQFEAHPAYYQALAELPRFLIEESLMLVHGSPRQTQHEYCFPTIAEDPRDISEIFSRFEETCVCGHTHIPGVFSDNPWHFLPSTGVTNEDLNGRKRLVNVGSVGQPRDEDPRACYAVINQGFLNYERVEYDIDAVRDRNRQIPELADRLADRLYEAR